ncbi:MAG: uncharacterized protein JWQ98_13 [Chlorobi bacterium]|nr:uncharacterized protein [Chlorobiota bacterium]
MPDTFYPIGSVLPYAGPITADSEEQIINAGFIPCDGRGLPKSSVGYAALLTVIGSMYGGNNTTFYVPDYRGMFLRGVDAGTGRDPDTATRGFPRPDLPVGKQGNSGDNVGSLQSCNIVNHNHGYSMHTGSHHCNRGSKIGPGVYTGDTSVQTSSSAGGSEARPVNLYTNYVIRYA